MKPNEEKIFYTKFYWKDFLVDTCHISPAEVGFYIRLLGWYYTTQEPLSPDDVYRTAGARTPGEDKAVDRVISKFWVLTDDGYINERAQKEIRERIAEGRKKAEGGRKGGQTTQRNRRLGENQNGNPSPDYSFDGKPVNEPTPDAKPTRNR